MEAAAADAAPSADVEDIADRVRAALEPLDDIAVAVLFGSRAKGTARPNSDLDVALIPSTDDPHRRLRLLQRAAAELASLVPSDRADVVFLDEAPVLLRQRVMEHGKLVLVRDEAPWKRLRVKTMREWGDMEPYRKRYMAAQRRRLMEGDFSGRRPRALESLERIDWLSRRRQILSQGDES